MLFTGELLSLGPPFSFQKPCEQDLRQDNHMSTQGLQSSPGSRDRTPGKAQYNGVSTIQGAPNKSGIMLGYETIHMLLAYTACHTQGHLRCCNDEIPSPHPDVPVLSCSRASCTDANRNKA